MGLKKRSRILVCIISLITCIAFAVPETTFAAPKKPAKVTSFKVKSISYNYVSIKWGKQNKVRKYEVYRATKKGGKYKRIAKTKKTSYTDKKVNTGKTYWYKVRAVSTFRKGDFSNPIKCVPRLKKPGFGVRCTLKGAELVAKKVKGATGYAFYRDGREIKRQKGIKFTDSKIVPMKPYTYRVAAYRKSGGKIYYSDKSRTVPGAKISANISLTGCAKPQTLNPASDFTLTGKIKSNMDITGVEIGIVNKDKNSWVANQKYQKFDLKETREFDISKANDSVHFDGLGGGTYRYRIYVHFDEGVVYTLLNYKFSVKKSKGAKAAVVWARGIANDNSFTYGTKGPANHRGCYFCKTFGAKKKHLKRLGKPWTAKWEKTYCCNPFIFAAYAHGAKDPNVLAGCKKGKCGGMNPSDWTQFKCFRTVGKCKNVPFKDLNAGDVIISNKKINGKVHHVWMYCGGSEQVEASGGGWSARSISVKTNAKTKYAKYQKLSGTYVLRYTGK